MSGNEFESAIVSEIYKQAKNIGANVRCYHLRTQDGKEVDLLIETPEGYYAFEIKMTEKVTHTDARHLRNLQEILTDKPLLHSYLISNDTHTQTIQEGITAIHAGLFLG